MSSEELTQQQKPKKKYRTSNEAKARYNNKTYAQYGVKLKFKDDAEIVKLFESNRANGLSPSDTIRQLYNEAKKNC